MANKKISELTAASALAGTEEFEVVQSGSKKATVDQAAAYIRRSPINSQIGTTYTFVLADAGKTVRGNNASAQTYTVPANATAAFTVGDSIAIRQVGAGQITLSPAGGVTINEPTGFDAKTARQGSTILIHKVGTDEWDLTGDIAETP